MIKFIMLVGLPCSGKSTIAQSLQEKYSANVFSSDAFRIELYNDVNDQEHNQELFVELHKRIKNCLESGKSAIYDATNISYKRRMAFLSELKKVPCEKVCIVMATPYEECLKRNADRERKVPGHVIKRMYRSFNIPYWYEGWDDIRVEYGTFKGYYGKAVNFVNAYIDYDQNNSHHTLTLGEHCRVAAIRLDESASIDVFCATYIHDCGKPDVATFKNKKGETTEECHYYDHQYTGCYKSLFYNWEVSEPLNVAVLVMWHMQPYFNKEEKTKEKYRKLWGDSLYEDIMKLHRADEAAH